MFDLNVSKRATKNLGKHFVCVGYFFLFSCSGINFWKVVTRKKLTGLIKIKVKDFIIDNYVYIVVYNWIFVSPSMEMHELFLKYENLRFCNETNKVTDETVWLHKSPKT